MAALQPRLGEEQDRPDPGHFVQKREIENPPGVQHKDHRRIKRAQLLEITALGGTEQVVARPEPAVRALARGAAEHIKHGVALTELGRGTGGHFKGGVHIRGKKVGLLFCFKLVPDEGPPAGAGFCIDGFAALQPGLVGNGE